jgi:hypothetical protein
MQSNIIDGSKREFVQVNDVRSSLDTVLDEDIQSLFADGACRVSADRMLL